jgi:hypothetical protein
MVFGTMSTVIVPQTWPQAYKIGLVETISEFSTLGEAWDELLQEVGDVPHCLKHDWISAWLEHFPPKHLLVVLIQDEHDKLVAAAPKIQVFPATTPGTALCVPDVHGF